MNIVEVAPELEEQLAELLEALRAAGVERQFHPHPLTREAAAALVRREGSDGYFLLVDAGRAVGYGMLRGWDEGFEVPSLGIALLPSARGKGLGRIFMERLHEEAVARQARRVRLSVYPDNEPALRLYRSLGYQFEPRDDGVLIGTLELEEK